MFLAQSWPVLRAEAKVDHQYVLTSNARLDGIIASMRENIPLEVQKAVTAPRILQLAPYLRPHCASAFKRQAYRFTMRILLKLLRALGVRRGFLLRLHLARLGGLLLEPVYAAFGIHQFLAAGEEGMAARTNLNAQVAFVSGTGAEG